MPPGQPVHRCFQCGFLRPCKRFDGDPLCVECAPVETKTIVTDGGQESDRPTNDTDRSLCYDCGEPATAIYEATVPPAGSVRQPTCEDHAPEGVPPVRTLEPASDRFTKVDDVVSNGGRNPDGSARMLSRWTFEYTPAREFVEDRLTGRVLNACAGRTKLDHRGEIVRNDLNPERDADTHHDVAEIADHFEPQSFDTVVFDPPFDEKQAETKYDGLHAMDVYAALRGFNELVRPGGAVICFGWNSWGMRSFSAFEREETRLLQRGPIHRDVIVTIDRRTMGSLAKTVPSTSDTERSEAQR